MLKILVTDDSKSVHAFIKDCFASTNHSLQKAFDGKQALQALSVPEIKFDLILLDWEMPIMNGPDTFEEIKKCGIRTPVVMMTTRNSMEDIKKMIDAGISEYLMKPFTKDIFFEKLEAILERTIRNET